MTLRPIGILSNREAIGLEATVEAGGLRQVRQLVGGGSYLSTHDPRLHFGLGEVTVAELVELRWPSARVQSLRGMAADRILSIVEPPSPG